MSTASRPNGHSTKPARRNDATPNGIGTIFTNVAHNARTGEVWWEGKTPRPPADTEGWRDWAGRFISDRTAEEQDDLDRLLSIDTTRWHQEMTHRDEHLAQFPGLPHAIRDIHARITASLDRR
ncbi:phosphoenolpyruvate carboxykinase (GTP) [Helcobacillus massiliensis]|uniref:phosphoenolpyruvate carboxykinase (GTP) n=1 Tax=Helcobacillus massiliensis TaxID=521392 RepID=UPI0021A73E3A|nr:phosphoenolpyruvate carboxykinase (GTP) [Helcobacillus massiliensis]MCT2035700.1 phosphoenolpyruvate carboxykinase (GTP) [Helcobacillus massiliensis]